MEISKCRYCDRDAYRNYKSLQICRRCYDRERRWKIRGIVDITTEKYYQMFQEQNGTCLFCDRVPRKDRFFDVDHSHLTGKARGLLCNEHNRVLGVIEKNLELLPEMLNYIKKHDL